MPVYRLVFRMDFDPIYEIFDTPGKIMKLLNTHEMSNEKFLPELHEKTDRRIISSRFIDDQKKQMRTLSVEPISIHGAFESIDGVGLNQLFEYSTFNHLIKLINKIRLDYSINDLRRFGLRFFIFETIGSEDSNSLEKVNNLLKPELVNLFNTDPGVIDDSCIAFDGRYDDQIEFKFKFGPYSPEGVDKYLDEILESFDKTTEHDTVFDIDVFEKKFRLNKEVSIKKWFGPIVSNVEETINNVISQLN